MLVSVYLLVIIYFVIGAAAIALINKRKKTSTEKRNRWIKYLVYLGIVNSVIVSIYFDFFFWLALLISLVAFFELVLLLPGTGLRNRIVAILSFLVLIFAFQSAAWFLAPREILYVYLLVFCFDGFAQIIGQLIGKRKITPRLSPNKTWGGFIGAFLITIATSAYYLLHNDSLQSTWPEAILFGAFIALLAFGGDLLASLFKRITNVKDYGNTIPQHGGILDRFDSFIVSLGGFFGIVYLITNF
ncbi:MAG: phosphatidate cytidylyltransferase [Fluviicola sp.]|jgi:phosphatidate cytidylyltransferase|uniref:phosphatidate cytidylyltransferase n=1 Tax=Fluviicola sp. TaxID=1917219 RepID=UPI00260AC498|nr:phosphatidate cytidylyltransferase [Fluviicola sp.]MDF3028380.1 phosphatidate cytidylyltransferase [Fluviicola sp.]